MRIAVFGATGMAGGVIVAEAAARDHHVVAASRRAAPHTGEGPVVSIAADVADGETLDPILAEVDAAVLAIRLAPGDEHRLAPLTRDFLDAAERQRTRVLVIGGSAPLRSPNDPGRLVIDDPDHIPAAWRAIAGASLEQFRACEQHRYRDWVYLSPSAILEPGERTGRYRRGSTTLLADANGVSRITAPDLAIAAVDELEGPGTDRHFTVVQD